METKFIHEDVRGQIWCYYIDGVEYTILITKKGFARGGCIHNAVEHAVVLEGKVEYHIKGIGHWVLKKGDNIKVPAEHPHFFVALEDTIFLEWGADPEQKMRKDPKTRAIVEAINRGKVIHK